MNHFLRNSIALFIAASLCLSFMMVEDDWGFFGHRRINRMAVFTLPQEVFGFYKKHIEFITEHAVDPDKRRYATKHEAVRHYIDIDHWGVFPFDEVPRDWTDALVKYTDIYTLTERGDTLHLFGDKVIEQTDDLLELTHPPSLRMLSMSNLQFDRSAYKQFFIEEIQPNYYEDDWIIDTEKFKTYFKDATGIDLKTNIVFGRDRFSGYGILPYHLLSMHHRLANAFEERNTEKILRLSADFGHYIGDAHVPLHTTENYNGQLTNQIGIHAFWESRIPELYADRSYDFYVGKAVYIDDPKTYYWDIVLESHALLDSVLLIEKELSRTFPEDKQFCFEDRLNRTIYTQCEAYAKAYSERMQGMVERRMRESVSSLGSAWYSAWIDAGQPDLKNLDLFKPDEAFKKEMKEEEELFERGEAKGRKHDG